LRVVNREPGASARRLLDEALSSHRVAPDELAGYDTCATGHLQVAAAVAAGQADEGVACEVAALAYGLAFVPLESRRTDLVIPAPVARSRQVQGLLKALSSRWLADQLRCLPGYDPSHLSVTVR
jgi:putative molybdopterin biosynthesis protein